MNKSIKYNKKDNNNESINDLKSKYIYFIIIGLPIIFWAFAFPLIKISLTELSPVNLTILRIFIVWLTFLAILTLKPFKITKLDFKDFPYMFLLGFFGIVGYHLALNYGEQYISAGAASLIISTIPIFIIILALIFLSEKISFNIITGILFSSLGVIVITLYGNINVTIEINYIYSAFAVLLAAFFGAFYTVAGKKLLKKYTPLSLTIYAILIGTIGLIPFINITFFTEIIELSINVWLSVICLAIFPTVISYVLWYVALNIKTASELGTYLYLMPILSTILSFLILNERITIYFILGGFLIIIGLIIVNKKPIKFGKDEI